MQTKTTYIAKDGKEFTSASVCRHYEESLESNLLNDIKDELLVFDNNADSISLTDSDWCQAMYYAIIKSERAFKYFNNKCEENDYGCAEIDLARESYPLKVAYEFNGWVDFDRYYKQKVEELNNLTKIYNM